MKPTPDILPGSERAPAGMLDDLYQEVILDHNRSPRNFRLLETANKSAQGYNPLCGDRIAVYVHLEGEVIRDISFQGAGCAISKAAASIMTAKLKGKTVAEVRELFAEFRRMVTVGDSNPQALGKLVAFAGVHKFPARVKCAVLPWHAVMAALEDQKDPVSTEES
jgi:nitrogen fixation NifU-like protein